MSTQPPIPKQTAANDKLIQSLPFDQLTARQVTYADMYGLTLQRANAIQPQLAPDYAPGTPIQGGGVVGQSPTSAPGTAPAVDPFAAAKAAQDAKDAADKARSEQNAYQALLGMFTDQGLSSLAPQILSLIQQGYDSTSISYMLRQTPEYKARFAGNDGRVKNGLAPLSPAEYLATERAYRQALASAGLPASYYDNHADFTKYIENDTSPAEIKTRADQAMQFVNDSDPAYVDAFRRYYGAGTGDIAAYFLDGSKNEALLTKQITASQIGAAATKQGLTDPGRLQSEKYADAGISQSQAEAGFGAVADVLPAEQKIGARFGQQYSQQDAQDEFLGGMASARRKRQQLNNDEEGLFAGSSGIGSGSLKQNTSGSY